MWNKWTTNNILLYYNSKSWYETRYFWIFKAASEYSGYLRKQATVVSIVLLFVSLDDKYAYFSAMKYFEFLLMKSTVDGYRKVPQCLSFERNAI